MRHILAVLLATASFSASAVDACGKQLPGTLRAKVATAFPAFRIPVVTDNLAEDVAWNKEQKGNACLSVAMADFDGNGTTDWLLGLTAKKGSGALVIAALSQGAKWQLYQLASWPSGRSRLYVSAEKPGTYVSLLDDPLESGEVRRLVCSRSVAVFGATESSGVAYCYNHGTWQHAWFSE